MCANDIFAYVDFGLVFDKFLKRNIKLCSFTPSSTRSRHAVKLLELELNGIRDGYQIFYECLKETQKECPAHVGIIKRLVEGGLCCVAAIQGQ